MRVILMEESSIHQTNGQSRGCGESVATSSIPELGILGVLQFHINSQAISICPPASGGTAMQ